MVINALKRLACGRTPVVLLIVLLLASVYLMSDATQNSAAFGRLYSLLLAINILALVLLVALILRHLYTLVQQYRRHAPGSRLTARLVVMFVVLAVVPVTVVYYFAVQFLHRGIDSWFDVRVEHALEDSLELGRTALDDRLRELLRKTRLMAEELKATPDTQATLRLNELRQQSEAAEITLLTLKGRIISSSSIDPAKIVPSVPNPAIMLQLRQGRDYAALEPIPGSGLNVRTAVVTGDADPSGEIRVMHALYPISERVSALADSVQSALAQYQKLSFLRRPLKYSFTLTLSLVLLLGLLTAVWAAFSSARRLVAPITDLVEGTRAVAAGDYDKRLPLPGKDELGVLVRSFNEMTRKIAAARDEAERSQRQLEEQRAYLEAVLARLSSGVLTVDINGVLRTYNGAASQILGMDLATACGQPLAELNESHPGLAPLFEALLPYLAGDSGEWRTEVTLFGSGGRQVLMCRGSSLPGVGGIEGGHVIVFDDITALIQAQRDAAWAEVARRLAHEIKNPLTPIQLSAERMRRKYLSKMSPKDAELLDRSTHTIVQQVEAMKEMVKTFSEYAYTPKMQFRPIDLNAVIGEVVELYCGDPALVVHLDLATGLPVLEADSGRLRQLLHNLIKNAREAGVDGPIGLQLTTRCISTDVCDLVELMVEDNGPGIPEAIRAHLFEPYVTTKPKGTGLGLAIVKKIVEEHGGMLWADNGESGGARITIRLPAKQVQEPVVRAS